MIPAELEILLSNGIALFPCRAAEKRPATPHGVKDASLDRQRIEEWAREFAGCNWGAAMSSEVAALDLDMKNGRDGRSSLHRMIEPHGTLPETLTNLTPTGGEHQIFRMGKALKNAVAVAPGLDVRSAGGYIVIPPSRIGDRYYQYVDPATPIAEAPSWLVELLSANTRRNETDGQASDGAGPIPQGKRNDTLFRYACSLRARNLSEDEARAILISKNMMCVPPLQECELEQILRSAFRYEPTPQELLGIERGVQALLTDLRDDEIVLPNDHLPFPWAARRLFGAMAERREAYVRNGVVLELIGRTLEVMSAAKLRSRIDAQGRRVRAVKSTKTGLILAPKRCSADTADALLVTREAEQCLPPIELVSSVPVLIERDGQLVALGPGYHPDGGGVLVLGGESPDDVPLDDARQALLDLLSDFRFTAPADRSRAIAGLIGPAIRAGGLLPGFALVHAVEANQSQTGKGYLMRLVQAVYGEVPAPFARRDGGVGSFDEDLGAKLLRASMFVAIDNVRGRLASEYLESILTTDDEVSVRLPYRGAVTVNVRRMSFQLTSNGIEATADLSNRMLITRLLKQPRGYRFRQFEGGGLLEHVRARQVFYLGCVHAIVRRWYAAGKPQLHTGHTFREWTGALDWIVREVFRLPALLEDHNEAVERVANPALGWLRAMALVVVAEGLGEKALSATKLHELSDEHGVPVPGARADMADDKVLMIVGRLLARCFREDERLVLDSVKVRRWEFPWADNRSKTLRRYQFWTRDVEPPEPADIYSWSGEL